MKKVTENKSNSYAQKRPKDVRRKMCSRQRKMDWNGQK